MRESASHAEEKKQHEAINAEIRKDKLDSINNSLTKLELLKTKDFEQLALLQA